MRSGAPSSSSSTRQEKELAQDAEQPETQRRPPRTVVPRWVQLVVLPLAIIAAFLLARAAGKVLLIFIIAALIGLILNPAVEGLQRRVRLPRGLAVLTVYMGFFLALAGIGLLLANPVSNQVQAFAHNVPI